MSLINVLDFGADRTQTTDSSAAVASAFKSCKNGDTVVFPKGRYLFMHRVTVSGIDGITVKGENAVIAVHFCRSCFDGLEGAFRFQNCPDTFILGC